MLFAVPQLKLILNFWHEMGGCIRMRGSWICLQPTCVPARLRTKTDDAESQCLIFGTPSTVPDLLPQTPGHGPWGKPTQVKIRRRDKAQLQPADLPPACLALCVCVAVVLWAGLKARISVSFVLRQRVKHSSNVCFTFCWRAFHPDALQWFCGCLFGRGCEQYRRMQLPRTCAVTFCRCK